MMRNAALLAMLHAAGALAADADAPVFSFSGFGTLGVVHSGEDRADFTSAMFKPSGAGHTRAWSADVDSLIGVQLAAHQQAGLSAVLQVIAEQNYDDTYRPHVEWANIKYQVNPDLFVRVGRTVLPILMVTDSRKVGFANPWLRPPVEVYILTGVTSNDGIDASHRMQVATATNTFQLAAGRSDTRFPGFAGAGNSIAEARGLVAIADTIEQGYATVRFNYGRARVTIPELAPLFNAFRQFGPQGEAIADRYEVNDSVVTFLGVGALYDPGPWFAMAEWSTIESRTIFGRKSAWYASAGYRFGKLTPYVTYAAAKANQLSDPGLAIAALPPFLAGPALGLNAALNSILETNIVQNTISVGGRWDFMKNAAFKVQYDHVRIGAGSQGAVVNAQPDYRTGGKLDVFSVTLDFVF